MLITPPKDLKNEIDIIVHLFESGLETLHLRKPNMSTRRMKEYISNIPSYFHNRIIIHSHHRLAFKFSLKGVHLTEYHLKHKLKLWWLFQKEKLLGKSFVHTRSYSKLSDIFCEEKYFFNYYLLRNVFNRITKEFNIEYHPVRINEIMKLNKNLVVRGGVNIETVLKAKKFNFYGACLNSYIWQSTHPVQSFIELKKALDAQ